jgi:hypothetical protein
MGSPVIDSGLAHAAHSGFHLVSRVIQRHSLYHYRLQYAMMTGARNSGQGWKCPREFPGWWERGVWSVKREKGTKFGNDTTRFGQPEIRVQHREGSGKRTPHYILRCGCCSESLQIHYANDGLEIVGFNGALQDWREILLPLLLIERRGNRFVDVSRKREKSAHRSVQRTGASRSASSKSQKSPAVGFRR